MPKLQTTVGQLMINSALPEELRDYSRVLDKKGLSDLLAEVGHRYPDQYRDVSHKLNQVGRSAAYTTGGNSFGIYDLRQTKGAVKSRQLLQRKLDQLMDDDELDDDKREDRVIRLLGDLQGRQDQEVYDESLAEGNPLAEQVRSGSRGSPTNLSTLRASDLLYIDHRDRLIPLPVMRSYSQGLRPAEYWAAAYGARKGVMDTKFATQAAGFLSKQLNQIAHRSLVTDLDVDGDGVPDTLRGYPTTIDDPDNEGALLATDTGDLPRNTVLTPKLLNELRRKGVKNLLVRSSAVGGSPDGGVYARDAGVREYGRLPQVGENVGLTAVQALSEPLLQAQLSSKHSGGVASANPGAVSGFDSINQLVQVPKTFRGGAAHSEVDGLVQSIRPAPAGGNYVLIEGKEHYVASGFDVRVKRGDKVEAGDVISEGLPNPSTVVQHKGVGEGRRYFVDTFRAAMKDAGLKVHRRNIELLARGLINHVRLTEETADGIPDDVLPYGVLEHNYKPREGYQTMAAKQAVGKYLERPYLHYSIGTKIRPSVIKSMSDYGVTDVDVHDDPPPFEPEMMRGMANLQHDPDWQVRLFGSGLKSSLLDGAQRGATSTESGTSYVPGLARAVDFGKVGPVKTPQPVGK